MRATVDALNIAAKSTVGLLATGLPADHVKRAFDECNHCPPKVGCVLVRIPKGSGVTSSERIE